ncbi:MAG: pyridoxal phosphate-dependent aminotransferase [Peptoniphilaceae bacterium]|nr:pyridoxal phosphate-dependent aminotransferase [Peptoniphilaceae bacterium]MDY5766376.1 pyridoxal phosphate-dependent aminotransferase [Peptoniphilaceae bacterium]
MKFSNRVSALQESPIRKFGPMARETEEQGVEVIHLNIGQPDIPTPHDFLEAVRRFDVDVLAYQDSRGMKRTLETMQLYLHNYGLDFDLDEICITNGASEGLSFTMTILCDPGDSILCVEPFYTNYNSMAQAQGINIVTVTARAEDGFRIPSKEEIRKTIRSMETPSRLKAILLSSPANPTGRVYTREEMQTLVDIAVEQDLWIMADEVYREFNYTDRPFYSFMEFEEVRDRVILIDSISKKYSACGARIGSISSKNARFNAEIMKLCQMRLSVSTLDQIGAGAMDVVDDEYVYKNRRIYRERRNALQRRLNALEGVIAPVPEGAFYNIIKLPVENAEEFTKWTLQNVRVHNATVLMTPAESFYRTPGLGRDEVRISYCVSTEKIEQAMDILQKALEEYPGRLDR